MATSERIDGATPHGGVYTIAHYRDDDLRPVEKEDATQLELVEYGSDDQPLFQTFLPLTRQKTGEP